MKIIRINEIRIIYKNFNEYTIKTTLGDFKDINEAIEYYPHLKEDNKNIKKCGYCGRYFIKAGRKDAARKYCSTECSDKYYRIYQNEYNRMWKRDKWLRDSKKRILTDRDHHWTNPEYYQDDRFWGIGSSHITEHPKQDPDTEHLTIKKELKRLGLKAS